MASSDHSFVIIAAFFIPSFLALRAQPCPSECRCYSMAVECGSKGLKAIPTNIHPSTQVGPFFISFHTLVIVF